MTVQAVNVGQWMKYKSRKLFNSVKSSIWWETNKKTKAEVGRKAGKSWWIMDNDRNVEKEADKYILRCLRRTKGKMGRGEIKNKIYRDDLGKVMTIVEYNQVK